MPPFRKKTADKLLTKINYLTTDCIILYKMEKAGWDNVETLQFI